MKRVKLTRVFITDKNKEGQPLKDKNQKNYWRIGIQIEGSSDWYSCLAFKGEDPVLKMKEGDEVILTLIEENGYKNFRMPSRIDIIEGKVEEIFKMVKELKPSKPNQSSPVVAGDPEINPDDIPF